jgi:hypothetical protein
MAKRNHKLFTIGNAKTKRGEARGYYTAVLHLAPSNRSGTNVCPMASPGCIATCLNTSGRGRFDSVQSARLRKTRQYLADPRAFEDALSEEIEWHKAKADRQGMTLTVRVNGTSDLPALARSLARRHPDVQFYDYTKITGALLAARDIPNLHYTFSHSERNAGDVRAALALGVNVAVPFAVKKGHALPTFYGDIVPSSPLRDIPVIDGDVDDLRFLDDVRGAIVGLRAKGSAKNDTTGFVVR